MSSIGSPERLSTACLSGSVHVTVPGSERDSLEVSSGRVARVCVRVRVTTAFAGCSCMSIFSWFIVHAENANAIVLEFYFRDLRIYDDRVLGHQGSSKGQCKKNSHEPSPRMHEFKAIFGQDITSNMNEQRLYAYFTAVDQRARSPA